MTSLFNSDDEKRAFLEIKPEDAPHIRSMKAELLLLMDMAPEEKRIFLQEKRVTEEENWLQSMIDSNKHDDEFAKLFAIRAKRAMLDYEVFKDAETLTEAELCTEIAQGTLANKYTIKDIRKQREKIQWERSRLKTMQQNVEPSQSSSNSKT